MYASRASLPSNDGIIMVPLQDYLRERGTSCGEC
jgi:hypothetical protein